MTGGSISTTGEYSNGIQAGAGGTVTGTDVVITADGQGSHTFGVEADRGGRVELSGGSIIVENGLGAAGVRAYTGSGDASERGVIHLDGVHVAVTGASSVGMMAGDGSGAEQTAGDISFKNASVSVDGSDAIAARVVAGSVLTLENATLDVNNAAGDVHAVRVDGTDSVLEADNLTVYSSASGRARGIFTESGGQATIQGGTIETAGGSFSHAMQAEDEGSVITAVDVDVKTTGYAAAAMTGGQVVLEGGTFDVVGTTTIEDWDSSAGFVVGGYAHTPNARLTAHNVRLVNSVPLDNATVAGTSWALRVGAGYVAGPQELNAEMALNDSDVIASGPQRQIAAIQNSSHLVATDSYLISEQDAGISLYDNASLTLNNSTLAAGEESLRSSFSNSGSEQFILVTGESVLDQNNGTLLRVQRNEGGEDGEVTLTLQDGAYASGNIRNYDAAGNLVASDLTQLNVQSGAQWAGVVIDDTTVIIDDNTDTLDEFTTAPGEDVSLEGSGDVSRHFNGATDIGGSASVGPGMQVTFNGPAAIAGDFNGLDHSHTTLSGVADIGGSLVAGEGSSLSFNDKAAIGGGVQAAGGASMAFAGQTNIGGSVSGLDGASFRFSQSEVSTIDGDVNLRGGSSIAGGSTQDPVQILGNAQTDDGSVLGGNLNVVGKVSGAGGILSPGNSIGEHTYGSLGELATTYVAEVNAAGHSDLITIASGNADLTDIDLLVSQEDGNGGYRLHHDYTILQTDKPDGISAVADNQFASEALDDTFTGTLVKLDPVKYGDSDVRISLSVDGDAIDRTRYSPNQSAVLDGALSVSGHNVSADAVMFMQPDARKDALDQLSGELHGSTQSALLQSSSLVSRTLTQRMRSNLGAGMLAGAPVALAGGSSTPGVMPTSAAYPLWAQLVGNWSSLESDGNAAKVKTNAAGLFIGGDVDVGSGWRVGGALGYTDGRIKVDDRDSRSDVKSYTAAVYGGNSWAQGDNQLNFLVGGAYTYHDIDTRRRANVGGSQTLKADYRAYTTQLFTEFGYAVPVSERSVIEPYVGLGWINQKAKSFSEGGGAAALRSDSQRDDITTVTLGLRGQTELKMGPALAQVYAGLGWRHASGDVDPSRQMSFVQGGGTSFNVAGAPIARNAAVLDLGVELSVSRNTAVGLGYSGQYGNDNSDHSGQLYMRTRF